MNDTRTVNMAFQVQELVSRYSGKKSYKVEIWDGPDGLDHDLFECMSLSEVFEKLTILRFLTSSQYAIDIGEPHAEGQALSCLAKQFFASLNPEP